MYVQEMIMMRRLHLKALETSMLRADAGLAHAASLCPEASLAFEDTTIVNSSCDIVYHRMQV